MSYEKQTTTVTTWTDGETVVSDLASNPPLTKPAINPAVIPSTGVYKAQVFMNGVNGQTVQHALHGAYIDTGTGPDGDPLELISTIIGQLNLAFQDIQGIISTLHSLIEVVVYVYDAFSDDWVNIGVGSLSGTGTSAVNFALPSQNALKLNVKTAIPSVVGGPYISGFTTNVTKVDGLAATGVLTDLSSYAVSLFATYVGTQTTLYPGVWSTVLKTLALARVINVDNVFDGQRKRKFGVGN